MDLTGVRWRKSSRSGNNGECVEVGTWRKSSRSGSNGDCVEVGPSQSGVLAVRDSKDPSGPVLVVAPSTWQVFTNRVKTGAFPSS